MKILGCQYGHHRGSDAAGSHVLTFTVDDANRESVIPFIKLRKGTEMILLAFITGEDDQEINELATESEDDTRTRLNRQMHAIIGKIAKEKSMSKEEIKKHLKKLLLDKKLLKESTSELDIRGLAIAIYLLNNEFEY